MDVFRRKRPTLVMRGSRSILKTGPLIWLNARNSARRISASVLIVRNLNIVNGLPCRPPRNCRKKTGPGEVSLISAATSTSSHETKIRPTSEPVIDEVNTMRP